MRRFIFIAAGLLLMTFATRLLIAGGGGSFTPPVGGSGLVNLGAAPAGGWSWFGDPRAVYHDGRTHWGYAEDPTGDIVARYYEHALGTVSAEGVLRAGLNANDHANPALLVRDSDKRIMAFYSAHNGGAIYQRISTNPNDSTSWGAEVNLDSQLGSSQYTYPNPVQLTGETNDPIYLFYRNRSGSNNELRRAVSTDGGVTWSAGVAILSGNGFDYWKVSTNGIDRIDFAVSDGNPLDNASSPIYHFYYLGGSYFKTDGTLLSASLPLTLTNATQVVSGSKAWPSDIASDGANPVIVYPTYPTQADHRYWYARWNGSAWVKTEIASSAGTVDGATSWHYHGGLSLDHAAPSIVWASRKVTQFEIYRYTTADDGATFTEEQVTSASSTKQMRPVVPRGGGLSAVWMDGTYTSYTAYSVGTRGLDED